MGKRGIGDILIRKFLKKDKTFFKSIFEEKNIMTFFDFNKFNKIKEDIDKRFTEMTYNKVPFCAYTINEESEEESEKKKT